MVRSVEAFEAIYGAGLSGRVAGAFANDSKLSNGGERLDIEDAGGGTVVKFAYNDNEEWPAAADGEGASLVLINPGSEPDLSIGASWRASFTGGGNPGGSDSEIFVGDVTADGDGDGTLDVVEWAMSGSLTGARVPQAAVEEWVVDGVAGNYVTYRGTLNAAAEGVVFGVEWSVDLKDWGGDVVREQDRNLGDGTAEVVFRSAAPVGEGEVGYLRGRLTYQP